ncbi:MAG TPA: chorismate synthase [Firmicutes bacterium]|jgi:chorismate synthase|nr:chorismate synthase [Bacillota bacterium]
MLRYLTAGESHGPALVSILEGMPAGLALSADDINVQLARRQLGYGRGRRMEIESDRVMFRSGVRHGVTLGSPIALEITNLDWRQWEVRMDPTPNPDYKPNPVTKPRPGHADLPGALKYGHRDVRNVLERASARETASRVCVGAVARRLLAEFDIHVYSHVLSIGGVHARRVNLPPAQLHELAESNDVRCTDTGVVDAIHQAIDAAKANGDTLGGVFEVLVTGVPPGLGSHVQWDRKLDGRLAQALMSMQAIKGVEIGMGFAVAETPGSQVHDPIAYDAASAFGFIHTSNNAGGIEGGMSNGETIVIRVAKKPISTLYKPLASVDLETKQSFAASIERSDTCAVPAASVIGENIVAFTIAQAFLEKYGGDSIAEIRRNYIGYLTEIRER